MGDLIAMAGRKGGSSVGNTFDKDTDSLSTLVGADLSVDGGNYDSSEPGQESSGGLELLRDRIAARKNEHLVQDDDDLCRRPTDESLSDASVRHGADSLSVPASLKDRIKDRKERAAHLGIGSDLGSDAWSAPPDPPPVARSLTPPHPALHKATDPTLNNDLLSPKSVLRQRIADRKEGKEPLPDGTVVGNEPHNGDKPGSPRAFRVTQKKKSSLGLMSAHATVGRATPPRRRVNNLTTDEKHKAAEAKRREAERARETAVAAKQAAKEERRAAVAAANAAAAEDARSPSTLTDSPGRRGRAGRRGSGVRVRVPTPGRSIWSKPSTPRAHRATSDKERASEQQQAAKKDTAASGSREKSPQKKGRDKSPPTAPKARIGGIFKSKT